MPAVRPTSTGGYSTRKKLEPIGRLTASRSALAESSIDIRGRRRGRPTALRSAASRESSAARQRIGRCSRSESRGPAQYIITLIAHGRARRSKLQQYAAVTKTGTNRCHAASRAPSSGWRAWKALSYHSSAIIDEDQKANRGDKKSDGRSTSQADENVCRGRTGGERVGEEMSVKRSVNGGFNSTSKDFSRRDILILSAGAVAVSTTAFCGTALAAGETEHHGLSAFGDLGYPADFKHLKYVNPAAPKGGTFSQLAGGGTATFNSFNGFILKGDPAIDMEQVFAALMWRATDEPDAVYAYAADKVTVSADGRVYKFHLRDGITFHDGSPITAEDVAFSLTTLKTKGHPAIGNLLRDMEAAEAEGDRVVVVKFAPNRARSAPLTAANLPILSKAYYSKQAFDETSMEPPLGSGPYKVGKFEQGRFLEFERVKDWWGAEAADHARAEQFRRAALRLLPRSRHRIRRLQRQELHIPRGVHLARLGDALRFPGDQGRPRQARDHPRRPALRHARPG